MVVAIFPVYERLFNCTDVSLALYHRAPGTGSGSMRQPRYRATGEGDSVPTEGAELSAARLRGQTRRPECRGLELAGTAAELPPTRGFSMEKLADRWSGSSYYSSSPSAATVSGQLQHLYKPTVMGSDCVMP